MRQLVEHDRFSGLRSVFASDRCGSRRALVPERRVAFVRGCDLDQVSFSGVPGEIKALALGRRLQRERFAERLARGSGTSGHSFHIVLKRAFCGSVRNFVECERAGADVVSFSECASIRHWRKRSCNNGLIGLRLLGRRFDIHALAEVAHATRFEGKWRKALSQSKH
jgi:hypothetical protein